MDDRFRAEIVRLILEGKTEKALSMLATEFEVDKPKIRLSIWLVGISTPAPM